MPRTQTLARFIRSLNFRKNKNSNKSIKSNRSVAPMMIAAVALLAAVAFSVSVESRSGSWLRKAFQPSAPAANPEVAKNVSQGSGVAKNSPNTSPTFVAPFAPTVTATKTDALLTDVDMDGKADPGDTLKYTVVIGATGEDATGVTFTDTVDPNTAFVAGTLQTTPLARPDSYLATGNVRIQVPVGSGVLGNDQDFDGVGPALTVTAGASLSTNNGNVVMNADGSFSYNPAPGFEGSDTFTYQLNDGEGPSDTGTVTVTVSGMIWFINNTAPAGDGRLTNPFNSLAAFEAVNGNVGVTNPAAGDNIFVYESATDYVGPVTLENNQKFIGQDATAGLATIAGITLAPHSDALPDPNPTAAIVNITSASIGIQTASGNTLRGFTGGNAGTDINGTSFGNLSITEVTLNGNGRALALDTGTLTATIASISSASSSTTGVTLNAVAGSLTTGSTTVTSPSGNGINVTNSSGNFSFAATSVTNGAIGLNLTSNTGPLSFSGTTLTGQSGIGLNMASSSGNATFGNTNVSSSGGTGVSLASNGGLITFGDLDISPDSGQRALLATENTNTITATSGTIATTNATAVEITRTTSSTPLLVSLDSVSANGGTNGIKLGRTSGSFTVNGTGTTDGTGGTIQSTTNRGVDANIATNLTLKNMNFTNAGTADLDATNGGLSTGDNLDTNAAIHLVSVTTATLDNLNISGGAEQGINGNEVSSFSLLNSSITNVGNAADEDNIHFFNMTGTSVITNTTLTHTAGGGDDNLNLQTNAGTLNLTISGGSAVGTGGGVNQIGSGYLFGIRGTSNATITINNGSSTNNFSGGIVADAFDTAIMNLIVTNTTSSGNNDQLSVSAGDSSDVDLTVTGNAISSVATGDFVGISLLGSAFDTGFVFDSTISGNTITIANGLAGDGIIFNNAGGGQMRSLITGNTFDYAGSQRVIAVQSGQDGNGTNNVTITSNNIDIKLDNANNAVAGIFVQNAVTGPPAASNTSSMCADIGGAGAASNTFTHSQNVGSIAGGDMRVRQTFDGTVILPGFPGPVNTGQVNAYLNGRNVEVASATSTIANVALVPINSPPCTQPVITGSITSEATASASTKADGFTAEAVRSPRRADKADILWANPVEKLEGAPLVSISQTDVQWAFAAALERWKQAGISHEDLMKMQAMTFEIADLPANQLASTSSNAVKIDESAAGYGWYVDLTPVDDEEFAVPVPFKELQVTESSVAARGVDLMTVVMRQLGSVLDKKELESDTSKELMNNTLSPGVRRLPDSRGISLNILLGAARKAQEKSLASQVKTDSAKTKTSDASSAVSQMNARSNPVRKQTSGQGRRVMNHASRNRTSKPASMSFVDVNLAIGVLPAGKSITITFNAQVDDPFPGPGSQVCNQGTVSGTNFANVLTDDPDVVGGPDPTCTLIDLQADLEITAKTDTPDPVIAGNNITYTINFQNNGPNAAGATVTDATPAGTTFVSAQVLTGTGWTPTTPSVGGTGDVVFTKALVANGETASFEIVVKVNSSVAGGSTITNTATAATSGATDPVPGNNSKIATTAVIAQADLSITKTDGATEEIPGTSVTYTITVSNAGPSDANGVSVADTFPGILTGVTFTSVAAGGATGNTAAGAGNISDTVNMPAGSSITYTVNATIQSSATGTLDNTATVTAPDGVTDPDLANNSATDSDTLVPTADLSITKTDGATEEVPGTSVTYTIVVTNTGPSDAPGTTVTDTFPAILEGVTFTSVAAGGATGNTAAGSGNINDTLSMPAGSSVTYTVNATIQASATGNLENTATVTEDDGVTDNNQANNSATDTDTLTPQADLSITKTDGATDEVPGTSITYTIVVTNNGPSDAPGTSVADTFPATLEGVTYTSVAAGGATGNTAGPANGNINDTLSMPAGSSVTYTVNATIASSATGNLSNTATVTAGAGVTDPTPGNNSATDTDTLTPSADVTVDKSGPASITPGNNITYTIDVNNVGPSDAVNLSFSDAVPTGTTFVSVTTPAGWTRTDAVPVGGTGTITFTRASFAAGAATSTFTLVVNANLGLADGTIITNTVTVGSATADPVPANNTDSVNTTVQNNADLSITKQVAPTGPNGAGASVTYTIVVTNNGPSPATNVTFSDVVPAGLVVNTQNNPAGWTCNSVVGGNGTITCTKSGMADDETATLTVVATINCGQANGSTINNTATVSAASPADANLANNTANASFTVNNPAPVVTASVTTTQLPQNSHELINVGLAASATDGPCGTPTITVQVFGDEDDQTPTANNELHSPDAKDIAVGTLRLRGERVNSGNGRVYLIVVTATDAAGQTGFATVTVVVPKSGSPANLNAVLAEAAAAKAFADANLGAAPAGYFVIGNGPIIGPKQ